MCKEGRAQARGSGHRIRDAACQLRGRKPGPSALRKATLLLDGQPGPCSQARGVQPCSGLLHGGTRTDLIRWFTWCRSPCCLFIRLLCPPPSVQAMPLASPFGGRL